MHFFTSNCQIKGLFGWSNISRQGFRSHETIFLLKKFWIVISFYVDSLIKNAAITRVAAENLVTHNISPKLLDVIFKLPTRHRIKVFFSFSFEISFRVWLLSCILCEIIMASNRIHLISRSSVQDNSLTRNRCVLNEALIKSTLHEKLFNIFCYHVTILFGFTL